MPEDALTVRLKFRGSSEDLVLLEEMLASEIRSLDTYTETPDKVSEIVAQLFAVGNAAAIKSVLGRFRIHNRHALVEIDGEPYDGGSLPDQ
jgi:hypothetical protein